MILRISPTTLPRSFEETTLGFERQHDQRQRAVLRQQLAANDLVGFDGLDELVVGRAFRQFGREQRRRQLAGLRRLPRREQRNQPAHALDQLQVGDHVADLLEVLARQQRLALDHDQHVEFGRREALGHRLVLLVVLGIGTEQLAQRVVDLDPVDPEDRSHHQHGQNDHRHDRRLDRDQPHALQPEGDALARRRRLLDGFDVDVDFRSSCRACPVQFSRRPVGAACLLCSLVRGRECGFASPVRSALALEITR